MPQVALGPLSQPLHHGSVTQIIAKQMKKTRHFVEFVKNIAFATIPSVCGNMDIFSENIDICAKMTHN
jgi:hypothetical protein